MTSQIISSIKIRGSHLWDINTQIRPEGSSKERSSTSSKRWSGKWIEPTLTAFWAPDHNGHSSPIFENVQILRVRGWFHACQMARLWQMVKKSPLIMSACIFWEKILIEQFPCSRGMVNVRRSDPVRIKQRPLPETSQLIGPTYRLIIVYRFWKACCHWGPIEITLSSTL